MDVMFSDSSGYATLTPSEGSGDASVDVSADCNCMDDRNVSVVVMAVDGTVSERVDIVQEGVREQFIPSGEEEGFMGSDGDYFLGIKSKYADNQPVECLGGVQ